MSKDSLGDRMKAYEEVTSIKMPKRLPMIIRIDGKAFHTMTKKWKCEKPFDYELIGIMAHTTKYLCENIQGCVLGYCQSDEISLLVRDNQSLETTPYFDKKIQKIASVTASMATMEFNRIGHEGALFDARCFVLPGNEVTNYFIWRQQDAMRNSVSMLAQSIFSHKTLQGKNMAQMQIMCLEKGTDWNEIDLQCTRGTCVKRVPRFVETENSEIPVTRMRWEIDGNIPVFTEDRNYVEELV